MVQMKILVFLPFFLVALMANENNPFNQSQSNDLKPHIIDHPNPGCPTNAECSPNAGRLLSKFKTLLTKQDWKGLKKFKEEHGIPLDVWSKGNLDNGLKDQTLISWDSPCENHMKSENGPINLSLYFSQNLTSLKDKKHILLRTLLINDEKEEKLLGLREGSPLYFSNSGAHYIRDTGGEYYEVIISKNGRLDIAKPKQPQQYPKTITCPENIILSAKKSILEKDLYRGLYCQQIWNKDLKKYQTIVQGHSCL